MTIKTWPTLKSCKRQCSEAKGSELIIVNDRLCQLPNDVLMSIMSRLTMKEAAGTSILSRSWKCIWRCLPILFFEVDPSTMKRIVSHILLLPQERSGFTSWVNSVVEAHLGPTIDELRVIFDLDVNSEMDIDKWVFFSISKQVKHLEFDFTPFNGRSFSLIDCYTWPLECRMSSLGLQRNLVSLRSLCLKYVNVSGEDIERLLLACHALEDLCIVNGSIYLTDIKLPHLSLQLKHLKLSHCPRLMGIDIRAPKLVSFTHHGRPIELHIRDSSLLSELSIGNGDFEGEVAAYAYQSLSKYFSDLKFISWHLHMSAFYGSRVKMNLGINNPPCMTNLKHLEFHFEARGDESLLGWAYLIEASPVLEKLTMKFSIRDGFHVDYRRNIVKRKGRPLTRLKMLEHIGFVGLPVDMEFATYVVENSIMLKDVIVAIPHTSHMSTTKKICKFARGRAREFKKIMPKGVTFKYI